MQTLRFTRAKRARDTEAHVAVHDSRTVPVAGSRANVLRLVVPGTAADDTVIASAGCPRRTIGGRPFIVFVKAIFHPVPHIARHVIEPERIVRERADGRGLASVPLAVAAAVTIGVVFAYLITPIICGRCASASRVLPFGLGEQPVFLAGHVG